MNFSERFKGKTSIMTKEGLSALVRSSKIPVHKRSCSPELGPIEDSRPIKTPPSFLTSAAVSNNSTNRQSHFQEKQGFPKHPPTWPPTVSSQTQSQSPTLLSIPSHRPVLTQNSTPLRSRNGLLPNWDSRSGITETEPVLPSSMVLTGLNRGVKMNANEFMPSITLLEERMPTRSRAQSTIRERTPTVNDQFQPKISPDRDNILKPVQRIRVQKRGFTRLSPLRASVLDSEGIVNAENQEPYRERQFASQEDPSIIRRSTSHREFKDSQSQSPTKSRLPTRSPQRPRQEENMIPKLVEANIARYLDHLSDLVTKNKETFSYQDQRLHLKSYDKGRDFRSGPLNTLDSYRVAQSPAPKTDTNGKAKRIETRVTFKNDDIIDYVISQPQGKVYRSNSNEPFGRRHFEELLREERGESPFRKLTRRRVSKVENS